VLLLLLQMAERAAQLLAAGELQAASEQSQAALALALDELHHGAALGALECQLAAGELQEAEQQLEFMQVRACTGIGLLMCHGCRFRGEASVADVACCATVAWAA
jgi:hypothetical protein